MSAHFKQVLGLYLEYVVHENLMHSKTHSAKIPVLNLTPPVLWEDHTKLVLNLTPVCVSLIPLGVQFNTGGC